MGLIITLPAELKRDEDIGYLPGSYQVVLNSCHQSESQNKAVIYWSVRVDLRVPYPWVWSYEIEACPGWQRVAERADTPAFPSEVYLLGLNIWKIPIGRKEGI